ncbi:MAG: sigma-54 dependent transcriptional regulator [Candidatus Edwardsbacteria bacterium]|nr:sigma-54 dependent transcriptional regulator [Candidatus Edwardsbacteria bacterium]MBU1577052.1 sigma-54 dependent transcriptional regulator [Candidatus Edwardsbacteria bacterium]MBU2464192.1 sigma-54 dependent transcriptional regulator [Candidatus Edwardsbacteria bacterium]MBU2593794.1 sigma-54 dependent transcriptional regulator [Candidatus Edwardsbacteria bacterium]
MNKLPDIRVLVIDDEEPIREILSQIISNAGYQIQVVPDGNSGLKAMAEGDYDVVLLDMHLPDISGLELIPHLRELSLETSLLMITGHATVESAVKAIKAGAYDYLEKPLHAENVLLAIRQGAERKKLLDQNRYLQQTLDQRYGFDNIIAKSKKMMDIFEMIRKIADTSTTVLIQGESGTGKELVAKAIHFNSSRKGGRFVPLNCGGIPETLLESELFGHAKGAFTGAASSKQGLFQVADKGTIFLDEVATMPLSTQVKLLRVLQEGVFYPVGATSPVEVDVRVLAAANQDLDQEVKKGVFRQDLFYRLNVIQINLPSLRERPEDILLLAHHFLKKHCADQSREIKQFSPEAAEYLTRHNWPGNVRELENAVEHAVALCPGNIIKIGDMPRHNQAVELDQVILPLDRTMKEARDIFEKQYVEGLLRITGGNVTKAAAMAGMARQNMQLKLRDYGISSKTFSLKNGD